MASILATVLAKLRTFDTPTICNIIELFDVRPRTAGYMDSRIRACFPELPPMVGFAATATLRASFPPFGRDGYSSTADQVERFAELSGDPIIVFQDLDDPPVAATFGELMCATYHRFGAVGLVTNGPGRDLDQVRAYDFPVFTDGSNCSHGYFHTLEIHVPVHVGGLVVYPDDLLHGDRNGVTSIPKQIAAEVADVGDEFVAAEQIILQALRDPSLTVAELRAARAESKAQIDALERRLSRRQAT